jgi:predicted Zn-dependent peptidase
VKKGIFLLPLILVLLPLSFARDNPGNSDNVKSHTLSNRLEVVTLKEPGSRVCSLVLGTRTGSSSDPAGKSGLTALASRLVHAAPSGGSGEKLLKRIRENGGRIELLLSTNSTMLLTTVPSDLTEILVELAARRLAARDFDSRQFEKIKREQRLELEIMKGRRTKLYLREKLRGLAFLDAPARRPVSGTRAEHDHLDLEEAIEQVKKTFRPSNCFVTVAGDFDEPTLLSLIEKELAAIPPDGPPEMSVVREPLQRGERRATFCLPLSSEWIGLSYRIPPGAARTEESLSVISAILSEGRTSILRSKMTRDLGRTLPVESSPFFFEEGWLLTVTAGPLQPGDDGEFIAGELAAYIEKVSSKVGEKDLKRARNLLRRSTSSRLLSPEGLALTMARQVREGKELIPDRQNNYSGITFSETTRVFQLLKRSNRSVVILRPDNECVE